MTSFNQLQSVQKRYNLFMTLNPGLQPNSILTFLIDEVLLLLKYHRSKCHD